MSLRVRSAIVLIASLAGIATAEAQTCPPTSDPQRLNSDTQPSNEHYGPNVKTDSHGIWLVVWYADNGIIEGTNNVDQDIFIARSVDNGATWSAQAPLHPDAGSDTRTDQSPQLATDTSGRWIAVWHFRDVMEGETGSDHDIVFSRSADNGVTWSDPEVLNSDASSDGRNDFAPQLVTDGQGNWLVAWYRMGGKDVDILFSLSSDNGASWTDPAQLNTNADSDTGADYRPELATDGQGQWIAVWDSTDDLEGTIGTDRDILFAQSTNNGETWTDPAPLNTNADSDCCGDGVPRIATDGAGNWITVWNANPSDTDGDIFFSRSTDNGSTWLPPAPLNTNADTDSGVDYAATLATGGQGNWVAAWSSNNFAAATGDYRDIVFAHSNNDGITWSDPHLLGAASNEFLEAFNVRLASDGLGNWVAAWVERPYFWFNSNIMSARLQTNCLGDLDLDGEVTAFDLAILLGGWVACPDSPFCCPADTQGTGDGIVGAGDLAVLLGNWGQCP